ncbi:hypothetical protein J41TS12_33230 [Paenibacillus antibioticophila]|uniref:Uncharacterized protein n=1 Tax=Paenibacillus antibioticophila TaxID=1274374 RepID=A0A919XSL1_9BACL|nr:hypothetical protein [Paenibacillus antibioticophila]GIO38462.1 hypothetical protein J41TS12_33230 [Paenibacillus antibioticophila]
MSSNLIEQGCLFKEDLIKRLLERGCASIRYRLLTEIESQDEASTQRLAELYKQILCDKEVSHICRQPLQQIVSRDIHCEQGIETYVRILKEKGVRSDNPNLLAMLEFLEEHPKAFDVGCLAKVGKYLDRLNLGGSRMITAVMFAYCGLEHLSLVRDQIEMALKAFHYVAKIQELDEICTCFRGHAVLKKDAVWLSIYHFRLLAYTQSWRTEAQMNVVTAAIRNVLRLSPVPDLKARWKQQIIAPGNFAIRSLEMKARNLDRSQDWMQWLHRMELLARMGVLESVAFFRDQLADVILNVSFYERIFSSIRSHPYFIRWSPYTGMRLEESWKTRRQKEHDILFRIVLIIHFWQVNCFTDKS